MKNYIHRMDNRKRELQNDFNEPLGDNWASDHLYKIFKLIQEKLRKGKPYANKNQFSP